MNSVYLAARYGRRDELRTCAEQLERTGIRVTSTWLKETASLSIHMRDVPEEEIREIAITDIRDIETAEAIVFFAEDQDKQPPRGGRHVEFGYALAKGKEIHVIGDRENVFHHLPLVRIYATFYEFMAVLTPEACTQAPSPSSIER